ncbi:microfibrillar-associated protein [Salix suchowensis]|uniref:Micro-fibrillar-associated protein 1 C-terminal domain-containing protein n=2 Tax=Salix TaxID=40685 RepID=A0A6N2KQR9_SALVM|nr:microfibrillar-associated protein [Salix suchowensis]
MSVTAGVSDTALAVRDKLRGKIGQTKVKRYWPGKAPEWADDAEEDGDIRMARVVSLEKAFPSRDDSDVVSRKDDPRLRRLAETRVDNRDEMRADHRRIRQAEIISTEEEETRKQEWADKEEDDEDALEERRRRIKEKLRQRELEEAALLPVEEEEEEEEVEEEEEESEYETDSDEEMAGMAMVKPVFVPKSERDTIAERERLEAEEQALEEKVRRKLEERKVETKQILVEEIKKEEMIQRNLETEANIADVDTDDEMNEAEEYEAWKVREIARIKRDREDREAMLKEREEIERVRNMTEEERRDWERKNPKPAPPPKQKWRFMQKYFHKGAFFQDESDDRAATVGTDNIFKRDFSAPTGEDNMDKTILPKVMQVKHFGRSGRTKWTHLVNEDTTDWNNPWTYNDPLRAKYNAKMAGMNTAIAKPKGSKKLKDWESR